MYQQTYWSILNYKIPPIPPWPCITKRSMHPGTCMYVTTMLHFVNIHLAVVLGDRPCSFLSEPN